MDADRVEVFHIADRYGGVICVSDHLVFDLFVTFDALFYKHLRSGREPERVYYQGFELIGVSAKPPPVPPSVKAGRSTTG